MTGDGLPRAYLRVGLLLLLADGPAHGYELVLQVRRLGVRSADTAGVYRMLRSLEADDCVRSWWEQSASGPPRRTYELTEPGLVVLRSDLAAAMAVHRLLGDLIQRAGAVTA